MNEKVYKVLDVIVKVSSIVSTVAQIIAQTFKAQGNVSKLSQDDAHIIKDFLNEEMK